MKLGAVTLSLVIISFVLAGIALFIFLRGNEDNWIKDSKGIWIKHGNPVNTPGFVKQQQDAILCANDLYSQAKENWMEFNSQCLGACGNYSVDIVHVPRNSWDDSSENQCSDYPKITPHFIELDKDGKIVRVV